MAKTKGARKRKRKFIGFVILCGGEALASRDKYNGALTPVRKGESPTICGRREDVDFLIKQTVEWFGENTFRVLPLRYPVTKIMLYDNKRRVSLKKHLQEA